MEVLLQGEVEVEVQRLKAVEVAEERQFREEEAERQRSQQE